MKRDCKELYEHDFTEIDERGLSIGDLLRVSGYSDEKGKVSEFRDFHVITGSGRCLAVVVAQPGEPEVVVYGSSDDNVRTMEIGS